MPVPQAPPEFAPPMPPVSPHEGPSGATTRRWMLITGIGAAALTVLAACNGVFSEERHATESGGTGEVTSVYELDYSCHAGYSSVLKGAGFGKSSEPHVGIGPVNIGVAPLRNESHATFQGEIDGQFCHNGGAATVDSTIDKTTNKVTAVDVTIPAGSLSVQLFRKNLADKHAFDVNGSFWNKFIKFVSIGLDITPILHYVAPHDPGQTEEQNQEEGGALLEAMNTASVECGPVAWKLALPLYEDSVRKEFASILHVGSKLVTVHAPANVAFTNPYAAELAGLNKSLAKEGFKIRQGSKATCKASPALQNPLGPPPGSAPVAPGRSKTTPVLLTKSQPSAVKPSGH